MSLNGLDDAKVIEAHEAAIAEPGGWFLLKYASRDEVVVLGKGSGGIVEIRNAIAQFEETSPLFGFLRYRRRSVLIKYVPEDCSRLVQARVSVHFSAFTERFTPHDTVFPIASSKELRDVSLSAACSLHTASGSTSSSTSSLRRRRLMEIAEEAEEDQRSKRQSTVHEERPTTGKESIRQAQLASDNNNNNSIAPTTNGGTHTNQKLPTLPTSDNTPSSPTRRLSSQSVRPDMYTLSSYGTSNKPKIKLGPRPSLDHKTSSSSAYRPVSSLPAGLKLFRRGSKKQKSQPQSASISRSVTDETLTVAEMRDPIRPHTSGGRPTTSSGASLRAGQLGTTSIGGLPPASSSRAPGTMTPEKARLMKALQLRKKQMSSSNSESLAQTPGAGIESQGSAEDDHHYINRGEASTEISGINPTTTNDSAVAIGYATNDKCSEMTKTDSSPTSPVGTEHAVSTKASSLSESTEETVKEESIYPQDNLEAGEIILEENNTEIADIDTDLHSLSDVDEAQEDEVEGETQEDKVRDDARQDEIETTQSMTDVTDTSLSTSSLIKLPTQSLDEESPIPTTATDEINASPGAGSDLNMIENEPEVATPSEEEIIAEASEIPETEIPSLVSTTPADDLPEKEQTALVADLYIRPELETTSISLAPELVRVEANEDASASSISSQTTPRDLKIPRSKFSMPDLRVSEIVELEEKKNTSADAPPEIPTALLESAFPEKDISQKHKRKTSQIDRIRTDISAANSDNEFLEDDDLMDELQSATVQEAKPVSVAKSPMSQILPVSPKKRPNEANRVSRVFSNPLLREDLRNKGLAAPEKASMGRSVSAGDAFLNRISQQQSATVPKKVNVGSGISQRIKALEKFSSSSPATGTLPTSGSTSPAFFSVRQSSIRSTKAPSIADRANSLTGRSPSVSPSPSPEGFSDAARLRDRADSVQSRKETFNNAPSSRTPASSSSRSESISVTARIIRDPSQPFPQLSEAGKDPSQYGPLDLKSSPLIIDHQKTIPSLKHESIQERRSSKEIKRERRSSITIVKDLITSPRRSSFSSIGRRSITIEPTESFSRPETSASTNSRPPSISSRRSNNGLSPSPSATLSPISPRDLANKPPLSGGHPKSEGRGMKMLRRMSSGFSSGRKTLANAISPTVREETEPAASSLHTPSQTSQLSIDSTEVGDVNVQFPDTLLWKRRHLLLDSQGYLVLSASQAHGASNAIAATRRYHMSDLKMPFVPDIESQELPNSVSLEFIQGGGLQFACEDRAAQSHVLHLLEDAHKAWANSQQ